MPTFFRPWVAKDLKVIRQIEGSQYETLVDETVPDKDPFLRGLGKPQTPDRESEDSKEHDKLPKSAIKLENHPNCLPFFLYQHYGRLSILKKLALVPELRHLIGSGSFYIERDLISRVDPRIEPKRQQRALRLERLKHQRVAHLGQQQRIVALFMRKVLDFYPSRERHASARRNSTSWLALMWLGQNLAKQVYSEKRRKARAKPIFGKNPRSESRIIYMVNRLPHDIFFKDQEVFFHMLRHYMLSPQLSCSQKYVNPMADESMEPSCADKEAVEGFTRCACVHQNMSMSLKPCLVPECQNFRKPVCPHLRCFVPETITICSYASGLQFAERMRQPEDLMGCIFVTKPAYLCHSRGIRFILNTEQFDAFYRTLEGRQTSRHGILLQRYVESPRLIRDRKFTIRFFVLIIVLSRRRVVAFLHFGIVMMAREPYSHVKREPFTVADDVSNDAPVEGGRSEIHQRTIGRVVTADFNLDAHLTSYIDPKVRRLLHDGAVAGSLEILTQQQDNCCLLDDALPPDARTDHLRAQMIYVSVKIVEYMQPLVQDYRGCFQTIALDAVADSRNKLWIIGSNTNIFSSMLSMAPRQRVMMSAILQETLGITIECFYKDQNNLPIYSNYREIEESLLGILFAQDFNFVYDSGYDDMKVKEKRKRQEPTVEERYEQVDKQMLDCIRRRGVNWQRKLEAARAERDYQSRVQLKGEEES